MFLKKTCIFLAVSLLIVDIFLLVLYLNTKDSSKNLSNDMVENTVGYLKGQGIAVDEKVIVTAIPDNVIYTFESDNTAVSKKIAEKIADKLFSSQVSVSVVETPEGSLYSISDGGKVVASFKVHKDSFSFEYKRENLDVSKSAFTSKQFSNSSKGLSDENKKCIDKLMSGLSDSNSVFYSVDGSFETENGVCVCVVQNDENKRPIVDMYVNVLVNDGKLLCAEGNLIFAEISESYSEKLIDGVNALNKVNLDDVSEFVSESIVYMYRYAGSTANYLIPVWKIEYIDRAGALQTQYIDAIKN